MSNCHNRAKSRLTNARHLIAFSALSFSLALSGCMVGPKYRPPAAQAPATYKEAPANAPQQNNQPARAQTPAGDPTAAGLGNWNPANPQDSRMKGKWWEIYNDAELNSLEDQLNANNQNIRISFENLMAARAIVRQAHAQFFPVVGATPSWNRSRSSANLRNTTGGNAAFTGTTTTLIDLPGDASWQPDLWGKIRNTVRQAQYNAQLSAADLENERLTEQSSLAIYFFELRGQDALQQILTATVASYQKSLELARAQYETGLTDQIATVQAQTTLQSAQSQLTNVGIARAQYEHAIATLIGKAASEFTMPARPSIITPPAIPVGVPSQLLERRPDVAAAERAMAASNAQIGIATAAFFPNLTLSASGGFESSTWSNLLKWPSRFWSIGPSISQTIFDAGLRRATVNQYVAVYNANLAAYRQTTLNAFQQVEDALSGLRILTQQIQQQNQAVQFAKQALELEISRYQLGIDPYINVVVQQNTLLSAQQTLAQIEIQRTTASVQLIEALGGGWDRSQLPSTQTVTMKPASADTKQQH
ncbi:MAG TPA: efflux transporter outer membrane subunit [Terriglobales bacterium]